MVARSAVEPGEQIQGQARCVGERVQRAVAVIAVEDHPSADRAEVKSNFFHRGFKFRQVGCGEIAFWKGQEKISDYQKYLQKRQSMGRSMCDKPIHHIDC